MKKLKYVFCGLMAVAAMGCSSDEPGNGGNAADDNAYEKITLSRGEAKVANAGYDFAWGLFDKISEANQGANVCVSPTSANIAMTMLLNGADGETRDEIIDMLGLKGMSVDEINENSRFLADELISRDKNCKLYIANSLWIDQDMPIRQQYKNALASNFNATASNTSQATFAKDVNAWCSMQTKGLINDLVNEGESFDWALLNALYFQNIWNKSVKFKSAGTKDFNNCDNTVTSTAFMTGEGIPCTYSESQNARHAHVAFGNGAYRMSITLPKEGATLAQCIAELKDINVFTQSHLANLTLTMPKFEIEGKIGLNEILKEMGMQKAFDKDDARFPGISDIPSYVKTVRQGYSFKVDEKGATAAAVTIVGGIDAAAPTTNPDPMVVDRPFIFTIYETSTNCILFAGKIERF